MPYQNPDTLLKSERGIRVSRAISRLQNQPEGVSSKEQLEAQQELDTASKYPIHKTTSVREFLDLINNPDVCGDILDSPETSQTRAPWLVR